MGVHSGKFGVVNGINRVLNWSLDETQEAQRHVTSATKGGSGRVPGVKDFSGTFTGLNGKPIVMPGDFFQFQGFTAPDNDTWGGDGVIWQSTASGAIIDQVAITWDWTTGLLISADYSFSGSGPLSKDTGNLADTSEECPLSTLGGKIEIGVTEQATAEVLDVTTFTLTYLAENASFANSGTNSWMERKPGPIDWTASMEVENNDRSASMVLGGNYVIKAFIDAADYHLLEWANVIDFTGLTVNRDTGDIIAHTVNFGMNGCLAGNTGRIILPGEVTAWWPAAGA